LVVAGLDPASMKLFNDRRGVALSRIMDAQARA
jgi:hypothetical protein